MRDYEIMFIIRPDVPDEEVDRLITQMEGVVTGAGGKVESVEKMGRRRLAYRVKKSREGFYVLFSVKGSGQTVKEVERRFKVTDAVIRYLSVRVDEDRRRLEKHKALRAKQHARRPRPKPAGSPGAPPASQPATETAPA